MNITTSDSRNLKVMETWGKEKNYQWVLKTEYDILIEALEKIQTEVGTSTLAWKIANDALVKGVKERA